MLENMLKLGGLVKSWIANIPYMGIVKTVNTSIFTYCLLGGFLLICGLIIFFAIKGIAKKIRYQSVKKFFGISDLSVFKIKKMGKIGTKYYMEVGVNKFQVGIPIKKKAKLIKKNSVLWLIIGQKTYVLITKDPFAMIHLVHELRSTGLDISPCDEEVEKQEKIEKSQKSMEEMICNTIQNMNNENDFVELCRQRLTIHGFVVSDAPRNDNGIRLFINHKNQPKMIKCLLVDRSTLISIEEIETFKDSIQKLFVDAGILITTGKVSVAAVSRAKANNIEIIFNEKLVDLLYSSKEIPANKQYLRWELTEDDITSMLPEGIVEKIF